MKKIVIIFSLILCIVTNVYATTEIVALGDSITYGYGVEENEKYVNNIEKYFENTNCINLAENGLTTQGLLRKLENVNILNNIRSANYILISIGGNDFLELITQNPQILFSLNVSLADTIEKMKGNLNEICKILSNECSADIFFVPLYNPYVELIGSNESLMEQYELAKTEFENTLTNYKKIHILRITDELEKTENLAENAYDPHPNSNGQKIIADEIIKEIETFKIQDIRSVEEKSNYMWIVILVVIISLIVIILLKKKKSL